MATPEAIPREGTNPCHLLVIYEDAATHNAAMEICGGLMNQFQEELAFAFSFWKFADLSDPAAAHWVAEATARADIILFSLQGHDVATETLGWVEPCIRARTKSDGALALIVPEPSGGGPVSDALLFRIHEIAERLRMDFLPLSARTPAASSIALFQQIPEELGSSHWGLNE